MCLIVVTVADVGCSDEEFKRVILIQIQCAGFNLLLQLPHTLLPIAVSDTFDKSNHLSSLIQQNTLISVRSSRSPAKPEVFFVAPEYGGSCSDGSFRQHVMQNDNLDQRQIKLSLLLNENRQV